ncbi:hypothetical protein [Algoriphagus litoralis]|uniref:hypothetical protein n=1 Tax=Algoriphagus litoralis TaxID=2202829 RepID=UPI000DBA5D91|nr:hypothetical protein [Algoriphagus litoralis]
MKSALILFFMVLLIWDAQAQKSDKEKALDAMIQSGMIRREGNNLIVKVPSNADTAQYKLMYSGLITDPEIRLRFETSTPVSATAPPSGPLFSNQGLNTSGQAQVIPQDLGAMSSPSQAAVQSHMVVFGYAGMISPTASQQFTEHSWTVPAGVTSVRMEGWSAGADGYGTGTGGGAGGYFLSVIQVVPGTVFRIRIPASGRNLYPLVIQSDLGSLTMTSGKHPAVEMRDLTPEASKGGFLERTSGVFERNTFSIRGEAGHPVKATPLREIASNVYTYQIIGGKGGDAPRGGSGGNGIFKVTGFPELSKAAQPGNFPGGGGGAGYEQYDPNATEINSSSGASGVLIIYY